MEYENGAKIASPVNKYKQADPDVKRFTPHPLTCCIEAQQSSKRASPEQGHAAPSVGKVYLGSSEPGISAC
ncbi:hypothetical protein T05_13954 [Trichinella murrelli]|uniref:Uncharacterized protein n=1 Tax=Trichinella murrelli TaxID=144512 RepID=A0A0V0TQA1_9BILA|nr:hypothetical protein T05_13954 [Trichinella murrelli]